MKRLPAVCAVAIAALAVACTQENAVTQGTDNVAVVDGHPISRRTFNEYVNAVSSTPAEGLTEAQRKGLLENLVRGAVLAKEAEANGVAVQDETLAKLELNRLNVLSQAVTEQYLKDRKPGEEELRAQYDIQLAGFEKTQYRASHILVPTEEAARQVIAQLKAGADFAQLARKLSTDKVSAERGGDLDWFSPGSMTPPFAEAVTRLRKGETSAAPVRTEFGWHVLRVIDTRAAVPPPYESVKEDLKKIVEGRKSKAYIEELVSRAKITRSL